MLASRNLESGPSNPNDHLESEVEVGALTPPPRDSDSDGLSPISHLPPELLDHIFYLTAEPIARLADDKAALLASSTLRAATLVCGRWCDQAGRVLEQHATLHLPWTKDQLESYNSRSREPSSTMIVRTVFGKFSAAEVMDRVPILRALDQFAGVKRLRFVSFDDTAVTLPRILKCETFNGLEELAVFGWKERFGTREDDRVQVTLKRLISLHLDPEKVPSAICRRLLNSARDTLLNLEIIWPHKGGASEFTLTPSVKPDDEFPRVRHITFTTKTCPGGTNRASLSSFPSLSSFHFRSPATIHPFQWDFTPEHFNETLATLHPSARLTQLSLPVGKASNFEPLAQFLDHQSLEHLKDLLLPHLSKRVLDAKGLGGYVLEECERRGIRVVFQEELALLRALSR